jgi:cytochrome c peroxidase
MSVQRPLTVFLALSVAMLALSWIPDAGWAQTTTTSTPQRAAAQPSPTQPPAAQPTSPQPAAEQAAGSPAAASAPPVTGSFNASAAPIPVSRHTVPGSIAVPSERGPGTLKEDTPEYFRRIFSHYLKLAPTTEVFQQGGVPGEIPQHEVDLDPTGLVGSDQPMGPTPTATNAFFQSLGSNGRSCVTCHLPPNAMSVSVENIGARWIASSGNDPIFAAIDGADCPNLVLSTGPIADPRLAHSLLLNQGLFRIFLPIPENAEFTVKVLNDPNGCNTNPEFTQSVDAGKPVTVLSMYRRPRISASMPFVLTTRANLRLIPPSDPITGVPLPIDPATGAFESGNIMWDGREPTLESQASDATQGHAQAPNPPNSTLVSQIVQFEMGIYSAQVWDSRAHSLTADGGLGGPAYITGGIPGLPPQTAGDTFELYDSWTSLPPNADRAAERESVERGQAIFETRTFSINDVAGLTNIPGVGNPIKTGTCSACHNQVPTGNDSFPVAQHDIGIGGTTPAPGVTPPTGAPTTVPSPSKLLPIFELTCVAGKSTVYEGSIVQTNDPGMAMITGKCADIGRFTVPQLRGLAARAPYFSDGSAASLIDVVDFYNFRFNIGLTPQDKADLVAFLRSL